MDVSGIVPQAREIVRDAAEVYLRHTRPWFVGLVLHGSAAKGDFVSNSSDVDFQVYLENPAFIDGKLPLAPATAVQRDLARIDPAPFRYLQAYAVPPTPPANFVGPIPGAYVLVSGRLPTAEATPDRLESGAQTFLESLDPYPAFISTGLLEHGGARLSSNVRLLCTKVWPTLYHLSIFRGEEPVKAWNLPRSAAVRLLPDDGAGREMRAFHRAVGDHYPQEASIEGALTVVETRVAFLGAAKSWFGERDNVRKTARDGS